MKTIIQTLLAALLLLTAGGCGDSFLEIVPTNTVPEDEFLANAKDLEQILAASYDALSYGSAMGGQNWLLAELLADNIEVSSLTNLDWKAVYERSTGVFLGNTQSLMHDTYKAIARANFVLENAATVGDLSASEQARIVAECKFIRAVGHFELARLFAQPYGFSGDISGVNYGTNEHPGVPLRLTYSMGQEPRATVGEVYAQVIADLTEAATVLGSTAPKPGHATKWAAKGYLAKVYFQMNDFANAYAAANEVIGSGLFALDSLKGRFGAAVSPEAVYHLHSTDLSVDNSGGFIRDNFRFDPSRGQANVALSADYNTAATIEPADKRGSVLVVASKGFFYTTKFPTETFIQVPLVHLTELKLIRAESAAELNGDLAQATQDLNDLKARAGVTQLSAGTSAATLISQARIERRLEMVLEGTRIHDLRRQAVLQLARTGNRTFPIRNAPWDCPGMVLQFPSNELSGNLNLIPNPTGGCN